MAKLVKDKETEAVFDDWVEQEYKDSDTDAWTQVCDSCAKKHHLLDSYLETGAGQGICGVKGCSNEADHYYDFAKALVMPTPRKTTRKTKKRARQVPSVTTTRVVSPTGYGRYMHPPEHT